MAAEYDINLSNGNIRATLNPLEVNGPDNRSTPRLIQRARPTFNITVATPGTNTFTIPGDQTAIFRVGAAFIVVDSTANNANYSVLSSSFIAGDTQITTNENFTDASPTGVIITHIFKLTGDVTSRFIPGFNFEVQQSAEIDAVYVVDPLDSFFDGSSTIIPVTFGTIRDNINTPIALPLGQIEYTNFDANTSLKLPGKGVINYGEFLIENLVRMTEHFANDLAPELNINIGTNPAGDPLIGQLWYKTLPAEEGFQFYDGTNWTNHFDFDDGTIIFRDIENSNNDIYVTASETNLPAPWAGANEPGLVIWTDTNPPDDEPIFRVLSAGGEERLRVEHSTAINTGYIRTVNNFESVSTGESYFHGKLGIGDSGPVLIANTLTVAGNGITVNSAAGQTAELELNAQLTQKTEIGFDFANVRRGNITVNDTITDRPLQLNSLVPNPVIIAQGGGNVGINTTGSPTAPFQISDTIFFNEGLGVVSAGSDIRLSTSGLISANQDLNLNYDADNGGSSGLDFRSGSASTTGSVLRARLDNSVFFVDTDTLYVDTVADRVGINMIPVHPFDVTGTAHFNNPVGINNVPPSGTPVWLEVTGDIQVNSQIRGSDQSAATPTFTFTNALDTGMYNNGGALSFAVDGTDNLVLTPTQLISANPIEGTTYTFTGDTGTSVSTSAAGQLTVTAVTDITFNTNTTDKFVIENDGTLNVLTPSYESLVLADNDVPNKKYVDTKVISSYEDFDSVGGETIVNTGITVGANGPATSSIQVFLNGLLQREGATKSYTVTGSNQITFNAPLVANDEVLIYSSL